MEEFLLSDNYTKAEYEYLNLTKSGFMAAMLKFNLTDHKIWSATLKDIIREVN